jgi:hypothetical protein
VVHNVVEDREVLVVRRQQNLDLLELDNHLAVGFFPFSRVLTPSSSAGVDCLDDRVNLSGRK